MREDIATAEPQGFGSRSVAIDLADCAGSDCGITDTRREREAATKEGTEKMHERHKISFYGGQILIKKTLTENLKDRKQNTAHHLCCLYLLGGSYCRILTSSPSPLTEK